MRSLLLEQPDTIDSSDDDDLYDPHSYVASRRHKTKKFSTATLEANTVIVSCGMLDFEQSAYADGSSREFHRHFGNRKVETAHFEKHPNDAKIFLDSFQKTSPTCARIGTLLSLMLLDSTIQTTTSASGHTWAHTPKRSRVSWNRRILPL